MVKLDKSNKCEIDSKDSSTGCRSWGKKFAVLITALVALSIVGLTAGFIVWQVYKSPDESSEPTNAVFENGAVSCDSPYCAAIGKAMLEKGGSVADAAIAALLCMGVVHSQSMGLGGGFLLVYYNATQQTSKVLNARETAPGAATRDMFLTPEKAFLGPLSVAVPGEVRGYWELHKTAGLLPWRDLFQPTIDLCEQGFTVSKHTAAALSSKSELVLKEPTLTEIFLNPKTGRLYEEGNKMKRTDLVQTLRMIAEGGAKEFYEGEVARRLVEDVQELGGIITMDDMKNYTAEWQSPIEVVVYGNYTLHSVPPPGSGVLVAFIMKLLGRYRFRLNELHRKNEQETVVAYQRVVEAFKHAFAKRTELGDPLMEDRRHVYRIVDKILSDEYINEVLSKIEDSSTNSTAEYYGAQFYQSDDHGTAHVSVLGPNGDAISVTSTVNQYFGAMIRSRRTGIIYNDQMDDFSAPNRTNYYGMPPSPNNFIQPGKRPLSSMTPSIFTDAMGRVKLVIGTAGGPKIITATSLVSMRSLWFGERIGDAIDARRLHHQLFPMEIQYERDFPSGILKGLNAIGHNETEVPVGSSVCVAVSRECDGIHASADFRKPGSVAGF